MADNEFLSKDWYLEFGSLLPPELRELTDHYLQSPDFDSTSQYWKYLGLKNYKMLIDSGIENYAQNISRNYFTWVDFNDGQIQKLASVEFMEDFGFPIFKLHEGFTAAESIKHNVLIYLTYNYCITSPVLKKKLLETSVESYLSGNSPFINYKKFCLTLDLLSSLIEYEIFEPYIDNSYICEIGGGAGRTTDLILQHHPKTKVIYADIPPASFIAYKRFRKFFPEKRIELAYDLSNFLSLIEMSDDWDVLVCLPSFLDELPAKFFNLTIAIDCFHEFSNSSRQKFIETIDLSSKYMYMKIWENTIIPFDNIPLSGRHISGYYIPPHWKIKKSENSIFPSDFMEFVFEI